MDSLTHGLVGGCIAIISYSFGLFDSEFYAFLLSIGASLVPDIDVLTRVSGNNNYIRAHRGLTHNFFMWFIYAFIFGLTSYYIFHESFWASAFITFIAVAIHVLLDGLNSYGVKFTPKSRYIRAGVISTVDVFIILMLSLFILLHFLLHNRILFWIFGILLASYFLARVIIYFSINRYIKKNFSDCLNYKIYCAINSFKYEAIIEYKKKYHILDFRITGVTGFDKKKFNLPKEYLDVISKSKKYKTFTNFSPYYYSRLYDYGGSFAKVKLTDLRYHKKNRFFYFNCIFIIRKDTMEIVKEDISFSVSKKKIERKLWLKEKNMDMKLQHEPFELIKSGRKVVEMRLNDEKRRELNVGDVVEFTDKKTNEKLRCNVLSITHYKDFKELYENVSYLDLGYDRESDANYLDMQEFYDPSRVDQYGVLAIRIELIK